LYLQACIQSHDHGNTLLLTDTAGRMNG